MGVGAKEDKPDGLITYWLSPHRSRRYRVKEVTGLCLNDEIPIFGAQYFPVIMVLG